MANNLKTLNDALFRELERLEQCDGKDELLQECSRAKAVSDLAGNIIGSANAALKAVSMGTNVGERVQVRNMLLESPEEHGDEAE